VHLWQTMTRIYGHKWTSSFGDEIDPGRVWAAALRGVTLPMIKAGLSAMVEAKMEWPPSAIEFLKLCESGTDESGLPAIGTAQSMFLNAIAMPSDKRNWSSMHPALYWCYQQIGSYECKSLTAGELSIRFRQAWPQAVEKAKAGELVAPPELQLEHKPFEKTPVNREAARAAMASIRSMLD